MIEELIAVYLIHLSYFALVFMPVISSLGFPFSEELVLLGAGYLASTGFIRWDLGMLLVFIGVVAGDNAGYFIGFLVTWGKEGNCLIMLFLRDGLERLGNLLINMVPKLFLLPGLLSVLGGLSLLLQVPQE